MDHPHPARAAQVGIRDDVRALVTLTSRAPAAILCHMIRAYAGPTTNDDWVVEVDGIVRARFSIIRYGASACFAAAREANRLRSITA